MPWRDEVACLLEGVAVVAGEDPADPNASAFHPDVQLVPPSHDLAREKSKGLRILPVYSV